MSDDSYQTRIDAEVESLHFLFAKENLLNILLEKPSEEISKSIEEIKVLDNKLNSVFIRKKTIEELSARRSELKDYIARITEENKALYDERRYNSSLMLDVVVSIAYVLRERREAQAQ